MVLQVKPTVRSNVCHCMYLREHSAAVPRAEWPQGRTLIVHNIPPYCNEENVRLLFKECGDIIRVYLQSKPSSKPIVQSQFLPTSSEKGVQIAYVVFRKPGGVKNACNMVYDKERLLSDANTPIIAGLRAYIKEYEDSVTDVDALEKSAEEFMAQYYKKKDEEIKREKEMEGVPDEDGFIKVTRHGKNKGLRRTEETEKRGHEHIRSRKKKNELKDFYVFQYRETKRKHIAELQAKFEDDKKKVKEMKIARKFRPY
ncbi:ribosomal RNA-processing protein 7 homolog A isoform X2 [Aplysia californica]|uniref:Ribosomal RNA-processing protein 7 homolog A isoform X2 n=1 Tax=Aplysia californica TaxID=6500 RepID=A0ABM1W3F2_APLCA|nr:ribosomal RNA-processing protein 7 homolog A isoform X2 [Aplysia californica]